MDAVTDTHSLIWYLEDDPRLERYARPRVQIEAKLNKFLSR